MYGSPNQEEYSQSSSAISLHASRSDKRREDRVKLLDLPVEILSQIAGYLPLTQQIAFLTLHPILLNLAGSSYSPVPETIQAILDSESPYPSLFARLPLLTLYTPHDGGRSFIDVLVRARPEWILENLEFGRWSDNIWQEAFSRRFLRSWRRYKKPTDSWRAVFLRTLGRIEHRNVGCTHHENWTQFVTLHRNGSASLNRIYSRTFDPYDIYNESKHQNNFANQPTTVRVVMHLQDVRILAIGVLYAEPSIFVNPNAHLALHPPLLRGFAVDRHIDSQARSSTASKTIPVPRIPAAATSPSNNTNEAYFPLVRSISPSGPGQTTYGIGESSASAVSPSSPSLLSTFARVLPGRTRRASSTGSEPEDRGGLFRAKSRETREVEWEGRKRTWSFSRPRMAHSGSHGSAGPSGASSGDQSHSAMTTGPSIPLLPTLKESASQDRTNIHPPTPPRTPTPISTPKRAARLPYPPLKTPQPHSAFRNYPNYTASPIGRFEDDNGEPICADRRMLHEETEDEGLNHLWQSADSTWNDGIRMAEWDTTEGCYKRWVGPMLLVAQVHPCHKKVGLPLGAAGPLEGPEPDLGHAGMYAGFGYEDMEDLFPWIELRGSGTGGKSRRSGLGYE